MEERPQETEPRLRLRRPARLIVTLGLLGTAAVACWLGGTWMSGAQRDTQPANPRSATQQPDGPWALTLVNATHPLNADYTVETEEIENRQRFDVRAAVSLRALLSAARAEGLRPMLCSGWRSLQRQQELYAGQAEQERQSGSDDQEAWAIAATKVAPPGTSEHNLGLAADICSEGHQKLDADYENTEECHWLQAHAAEYGFILRYPKDKTDITGIQYEPWHYRYVGRAAAGEIQTAGICLEEYLQNRK